MQANTPLASRTITPPPISTDRQKTDGGLQWPRRLDQLHAASVVYRPLNLTEWHAELSRFSDHARTAGFCDDQFHNFVGIRPNFVVQFLNLVRAFAHGELRPRAQIDSVASRGNRQLGVFCCGQRRLGNHLFRRWIDDRLLEHFKGWTPLSIDVNVFDIGVGSSHLLPVFLMNFAVVANKHNRCESRLCHRHY